MSDPKVAAAIASGKVPSDITEAFLNESKDQPAIIAIVIVGILTSVVVLSRLASRAFIVKRVGIDDGLALASLCCFITFIALCIELIRLGSGRHFAYIQYTLDNDTMLLTQLLDFVAHIIYTVALLLCRVSGLAFYWRLCKMHSRFKLVIQVVLGVLIAGFLPQLMLIIFHCSPVTGWWPYDFQPEFDRFVCMQWGVVYSVNSAVSLLCDLLIFGVPIAMLWTLEMSRKKKVQLGLILLPGILVIAISVTRLILVIRGQWEMDMSWEYNPMLGVEVAEIGATLIALSVPGVKPVFDKFVLGKKDASSTSGSTSFRSRNNKTTDSNGTKLGTLRQLSSLDEIDGGGGVGGGGRGGGGGGTGYGTAVTASHSPSTDDLHSAKSTDGIYVKVDFDVREGQPHAV